MTIALAWAMIIIGIICFAGLGYAFIHDLPSLIERYSETREKIRQDKLKTKILEMKMLNEQMKIPDDSLDGPDEWEK